jgi:hypothetical protein
LVSPSMLLATFLIGSRDVALKTITRFTMIVSSANILTYTGESSYSASLEIVHKGVEQIIKNKTGKEFESTTYVNELYDGNGGMRLRLNHLPIISVSRVCADMEAVIRIKNTTLATTASVKVDDINVTLDIDGSTDVLAIATYPTLSALITAINALSAKGWSAEIYNTIYNTKQTSKLIPQQIDVTSFEASGQWDYLYMGEPMDFKIINQEWIEGYFPYGSQNISVSYTAGTTPDDITLLVCSLVKAIWNQKMNSTEGIKSFTVGDIQTVYEAIQNSDFVKGIIEDNKVVTL